MKKYHILGFLLFTCLYCRSMLPGMVPMLPEKRPSDNDGDGVPTKQYVDLMSPSG